MSEIAIVSLDTFSEKMAGPAIRVWEIARELSRSNQVRILSFGKVSRPGENFEIFETRVESFQTDLGSPDVVVVQGYLLQTFPWLGTSDFKLVVDLYDPLHLESLEVEKHRPLAERRFAFQHAAAELEAQMRVGDFFLCASPAQRHLWLGEMVALGRTTPELYDADPSLNKLIALVPFGLSDSEPVRTTHAIRGAIPGISEASKVVIWGGGIYNWFDPLTVIRAIHRAKEKIADLHLVFLGAKHPNPDVPEMRMVTAARELARDLGLEGTHVHFNESWVPYDERQNYLCDADVAVSAHFNNVETEFSFRTRILDYLWAGLPMVVTEGDYFADLTQREGLGEVVGYEDVDAFAAALVNLLNDDGYRTQARENIARIAQSFRWSEVLAPLREYCASPYFAPDRESAEQRARAGKRSVPAKARRSPIALAAKSFESLRSQGVRATARHIKSFLARQRKHS